MTIYITERIKNIKIPSKCKNCKYGFYSEFDEVEAQEALNKLLEQLGYK